MDETVHWETMKLMIKSWMYNRNYGRHKNSLHTHWMTETETQSVLYYIV